jgi:hypothetical protein
MAGAERGNRVAKHGNSRASFRCPTCTWQSKPTDVHSLCSKATFDPAPSEAKPRDQADSVPFSVKGPFQNEFSFRLIQKDLGELWAAHVGPVFAHRYRDGTC